MSLPLRQLRDLWIHTGTPCNLSCPFCHEGSKPADTRLQAPAFEAVAVQLDSAAQQGVQRFCFTGGEPLIHRDIVRILRHALQLKPCLLLTNGTAPLIRRPQHLAQLHGLAHALTFRVSIDHPDETRHDAGRGYKTFRKAVQGLQLLHQAGFAVGITRLQQAGEDAAAIAQRYRNLLRRNNLPDTLPVQALPELGLPGQPAPAVEPSLPQPLPHTACQFSRMLIQRDGSLRYSPCVLVDDDPAFDMTADLLQACATPTPLRHARCAVCLHNAFDYAGELP